MKFWKTLQNWYEGMRFRRLIKPYNELGMTINRSHSSLFNKTYYEVWKGDKKVMTGNINCLEEFINDII
ncbi:hypothetical protein ELBI_25 [Anabaena phage Elbi]|nr:hypothetical protein ELBI_25 [Anabaena phage Elbi]